MITESEIPLSERVSKLEEEVKITKGEIKKVLVDIREMMNYAENPFYGMEIIAAKPEKKLKQDELSEQNKKEDVEKGDVEEGLPLQEEIIPETEELHVEEMESRQVQNKSVKHNSGTKKEDVEKEDVEEELPLQEKMLIERKEKPEFKENETSDERMSLLTFFKMARWTEYMLNKWDQEKFRAILDFYELSGNLLANQKQLLLSISEFCIAAQLDKDLFLDIYRLNEVLNSQEDTYLLKKIVEGEI